jgi:hypothetical protein
MQSVVVEADQPVPNISSGKAVMHDWVEYFPKKQFPVSHT